MYKELYFERNFHQFFAQYKTEDSPAAGADTNQNLMTDSLKIPNHIFFL